MTKRPDVIAQIRLLRTQEGGRKGPTPNDKHHCIIVIDGRNLDVRLDLEKLGSLQPGQEAVVPIRFTDPEFARHFLAVGKSFKLREMRIIGEGQIQEVCLPIT